MCLGITKKTQVIKGELDPVWNEVRDVKLDLFVFINKYYLVLTLQNSRPTKLCLKYGSSVILISVEN